MITKTIQKQLQKEIRAIEHFEAQHRSTGVRLSALSLIIANIFSITGLGHGGEDRNKLNREVIAQAMPLMHTAERNETVRMPIRFEDGLRAAATTGS